MFKIPLTKWERRQLKEINDRLTSMRRIMAAHIGRRNAIIKRAEKRVPKKPKLPVQPSLF